MKLKVIEIEAYSADEAKEEALKKGINVIKNVTPSWKKENCPINTNEFAEFAERMFVANKINLENTGLMVIVSYGKQNNVKKPYKFENIVKKGERNKQRMIQIKLASTGDVVGEAYNEKDAASLAKTLMYKYKQDMIGSIVYKIVDEDNNNNGDVFNLKFKTSVNAQLGKYLIFYK